MFSLLLLTAFFVEGESKLTLEPGWKAVGDGLKSEYATQAAAATEKHLFVVSSTTVTVYDRATGKLLATSQEKAEHLNSAFVWKGKVYCAHSNYPKKPETSEIRVCDPETNKLTVFHDFKDPPGSLVWNIHDGKNWWCCFAHYQEDNAKTLLIKMTDEFKEVQRWTFPKKVVDDWDKMSASGGIWDGDSLLVSHHHYKVLYRLKVPKDGKELEFVGALQCPFPGQGIAADPKTGGLVGIDRGTRKVVFAEKAK
ncbi:endonuclease [Gemmata sp. G18]|uniref:Endonuclease n=1 Tax=Gemmata palustris TaxID=2822762 RepID=A0ABS5BYD7_9BACT|nr:endonuclease [Gemmata palustris]MBP3958756.1 endonuclease [Gemmata palustris]